MKRLFYLCSENKGADQLRGYREADLPLCFRICKKPVFSQRGSFRIEQYLKKDIESIVDIEDPDQTAPLAQCRSRSV